MPFGFGQPQQMPMPPMAQAPMPEPPPATYFAPGDQQGAYYGPTDQPGAYYNPADQSEDPPYTVHPPDGMRVTTDLEQQAMWAPPPAPKRKLDAPGMFQVLYRLLQFIAAFLTLFWYIHAAFPDRNLGPAFSRAGVNQTSLSTTATVAWQTPIPTWTPTRAARPTQSVQNSGAWPYKWYNGAWQPIRIKARAWRTQTPQPDSNGYESWPTHTRERRPRPTTQVQEWESWATRTRDSGSWSPQTTEWGRAPAETDDAELPTTQTQARRPRPTKASTAKPKKAKKPKTKVIRPPMWSLYMLGLCCSGLTILSALLFALPTLPTEKIWWFNVVVALLWGVNFGIFFHLSRGNRFHFAKAIMVAMWISVAQAGTWLVAGLAIAPFSRPAKEEPPPAPEWS